MTGSLYLTQYIRQESGWGDVEEQDRIPVPQVQGQFDGRPSWLTLIREAEGLAYRKRNHRLARARARRAERERRKLRKAAKLEMARIQKEEAKLVPQFAPRTIGGERATTVVRPENFAIEMGWTMSKCEDVARNGIPSSEISILTRPEAVALLAWCRRRTGIDPTQPTTNHQSNKP